MRIRPACRMISIALLMAVPRSAMAQTPVADRSADAAAIRAHIESIFQAFIDKDRKKLEETHGADWRGFTPWSGHVIRGRDGYMNEATFPPGLPKGQGMVGYRLSDFDVVFYGDTAVVSFVADVDRVYGADKGTQKLTLVDVYHKEPAGWIQVASNTSLHPEELERQQSQFHRLSDQDRASLLAAREAVWRAWFAGDADALTRLVPPELITIEPGSDTFGTRDSTIAGSRGFAASGGKLTRLAFPRTEFQAYGSTVVLYTTYEMDLLTGGQTSTERGTATEVFVQKDGRWINTGWQLAPGVGGRRQETGEGLQPRISLVVADDIRAAAGPRQVGGAMRPARCVSSKTGPQAFRSTAAPIRLCPPGDLVDQAIGRRPSKNPRPTRGS